MGCVFKSSLLSGVMAGILSIIPYLGFINLCCCLWMILGGFFSSFLCKVFSKQGPTYKQGALSGFLTGVFAWILVTAVTLTFFFVSGDYWMAADIMGDDMLGELTPGEISPGDIENMDPEDVEMMAQAWSGVGMGVMILEIVATFVLFPIFGLLGGLIGTAIFGGKSKSKKKPLEKVKAKKETKVGRGNEVVVKKTKPAKKKQKKK